MSGKANIELNTEQVRVLAKSISRSIDAELKKLGRFQEGSFQHGQAKAELDALRDVDHAAREAIDEILALA